VSKSIIPEIRVSVDVGCHAHSVAIGLSGGELVEEFEIDQGKPWGQSSDSQVSSFLIMSHR